MRNRMEVIDQQILSVSGPHNGRPLYLSGESLSTAKAVLVMAHGRGASAEDMLGLAELLAVPGLAILVPDAAGHAWYPNIFTVPTRQNEPHLSSALAVIGETIAVAEAAGVPARRVMLLGFSQGACLVMEYAARNGRRYAGIAGLSGGLIGADDEPRKDRGNLDGTPAFLGCSDTDPYIPRQRIDHSAAILRKLGADVTVRIYPNMGHEVNEDEIEAVRGMISPVLKTR